MNNKNFRRENMEESYKTLGITIENRIILPLKTTTQLYLHHIVIVYWMVEKENSLEQGGLLADNCSTGKIIPSHSDNSTMLTMTRHWQPWY